MTSVFGSHLGADTGTVPETIVFGAGAALPLHATERDAGVRNGQRDACAGSAKNRGPAER